MRGFPFGQATVPDVGAIGPAMMRSAVDFPQPDGPTIELFFGTDAITYSVTWVSTGNPSPTNATRTYVSLSAAMDDVVIARVMEGIHWHFDDAVGRRTGKRAADWAFSHVMGPRGR